MHVRNVFIIPGLCMVKITINYQFNYPLPGLVPYVFQLSICPFERLQGCTGSVFSGAPKFHQVFFDKIVQVSVENIVHVAGFKLGPQVLNQFIRMQNIIADL